ncbi:MAG TPA: HAMP domain-containing sensor histidine kinase [Candidatus Saccharimonadales bacterium]|nr:HAMP domain-containing sensor histidine kinase [Candidatus Saccharimonadales bacterium]
MSPKRSRPESPAAQLARLQRENSDLQAMNATKDEFIALVSHQLRTPATGVKQYLGMLLDGYMGQLTSAQKEFVQKAYDNNERQISIVNDLLQVAQIDANQVPLHAERCNVGALLRAVISEYRAVALNRRQRLTLRGASQLVEVWADPLRLRMAIDNIVDNASKYSEEHTTITLTLQVRPGTVVISVADHGVGIAEENFARLFQKFSRIDNPRSIMVGGSGLGLYLAKRIIVAHGGDIVVTSVLGKGTTFTIELPSNMPKI